MQHPTYVMHVVCMSAPTVARALKGRTFYDILQIPRISKPEEVRSAYLSLAKKYHPDSTSLIPSDGVDDDRFREIQEAYSTLSNTWKRTLYDQDLQYQEAIAVTGQGGANGVAGWRENFMAESPEARIARRQRYTRYAAGERTDLPPVGLTTKGSLLGLIVVGSALTYICAQAPNWFGGQDEATFHDPVTDDRSVSLVTAFYNPITRKWERLAEGRAEPRFADLIAQYRKIAPALMDRWEYGQNQEGNEVSAIETLTVIRVPKTRTIAATVFRDAEGDVRTNRRTMNEAISRFINRI